jgi:hypothetical protein
MIAHINFGIACYCSSFHLVWEVRELAEEDLWFVVGLFVVLLAIFLKKAARGEHWLWLNPFSNEYVVY